MINISVLQIVYTKLAPEQSPWGKTDFHTVFYPIDLITPLQVAELEARLHRPSMATFEPKLTVFFQSLHGQNHLVIWHVKDLPEARDKHGRGGIFLGQAFLFPPTLWQETPSCLALFSLVNAALFSDRDEILSSLRANWKTGDLQPLPISEQALRSLVVPLPVLDEFERRTVILLNRWVEFDPPPFPILIKGAAAEVSRFLDKLFIYLPNAVRLRTGWDSAFDGGNLTHFPLKIVGFSQDKPHSGGALHIDLTNRSIQQQPEHVPYLTPLTPFQKWFERYADEPETKTRLEQGYRLSCALLEGKPVAGISMSDWSYFADVNRDCIDSRFKERLQHSLGTALTQRLSQRLSSLKKLELLMQDMPLARLAHELEAIVLEQKLTKRDLNVKLSQDLVASGTPRLQLMFRAWQGEKLTADALTPLSDSARQELICHWLITLGDQAWLRKLLITDDELFSAALSQPDSRAVVKDMLRRSPDTALARLQRLLSRGVARVLKKREN